MNLLVKYGILASGVLANVYELLADTTVGAATTSVDFTSLTLGKGDELLLVGYIYNPTASTASYNQWYNGNTTTSNYYSQYWSMSGASQYLGRVAGSGFLYIDSGKKAFGISRIKLTNNGYCSHQVEESRYFSTNAQENGYNFTSSTFTATSITSLTITATITNAIGIGSRFQLYKIGGA